MTAAVHLLDRRVATAFYGRFPSLRDLQVAAIEPLLTGKNVVLSSGTGSGKTEAVLAPLVSRVVTTAAADRSSTILYISPTKALVNDLERRLAVPFAAMGLQIGVRHGDRDDLAAGRRPFVLLTTPESLEVLLFRKDSFLRSVKAIVLDEVHLIYNTQRGLQLSILIARLRKLVGAAVQWAALSATIGNLQYVRDFLVGPDESAVFLNFPAQREIRAQIRRINNEAAFLNLVRRLTVDSPTKLLVFANSRRECERLTAALQHDPELRPSVATHYSSLSPEVRLETEAKFASMRTAVCIATSTLELGIDIGDIDAVVLWDLPGGVESFLQRIGRGNRRSTTTNVVCLVPDTSTTSELDALQFAALVDSARRGELPSRSPYELFGAVAQQCLSMIASDGGRFTRIADLVELVDVKPYLDRPTVESILAELASEHYLQRHGFKNQYGADENLHGVVDLKLIYGNFAIGSQTVELFHGRKNLGSVPAINLLRLRRGDAVRFAGKSWTIGKISRGEVQLDPAPRTAHAADFTYGGGSPGTDTFVTDRMWTLIHATDFPSGLLAADIRDAVMAFRSTLQTACAPNEIPFQRSPNGITYFTFAGYAVNKAIGLISGKPGFTAKEFSLSVPSKLDWDEVPTDPVAYERVFDSLFEATSAQSMYQRLLPPALQVREFLQEWLKDETIVRVLRRLSGAKAVECRGVNLT
jgi:ATP-dependent Lhr-like helicase